MHQWITGSSHAAKEGKSGSLRQWRRRAHRVCWIAAICCSFSAGANNGLNLIGFGTESVAMGGADVALAHDTSALNTNPAGIAGLRGSAFDHYLAAAFALDVAHMDRFGNNHEVDNEIIAVGGFGYARPLGRSGLVAGIGLFAQGGAGNIHKDLATPFGGRDELSALFGVARVTPGLAWLIDDRLAIGVSMPISHARAKQRIFPNVSVLDPADPARSFFGTVMNDLRTTRAGLRLGVQARINPEITLGAVYATRTRLPLKDGSLSVNMSALGLGIVRYRGARIEGLGLPREVSLGAAWQMTPATLLSAKLAWLEWSAALRQQTLSADSPDNPAAPPIRQTFRLDWRDQYVVAIGLAHEWTPQTTVYAGFNYGRNPVPANTLSPLLAAIGERHLTAGLRRHLDGGWQASGSIEYGLPVKIGYHNPELPFGPDAQARNHYVAVMVAIGKRW